MKSSHKNQAGFGILELLLVLIIIGVISTLGWYVSHAGKTTDQVVDKGSGLASSTETSSPNAIPTASAVLKANWQEVTKSNAISISELNTAFDSLDDQSTFTDLP